MDTYGCHFEKESRLVTVVLGHLHKAPLDKLIKSFTVGTWCSYYYYLIFESNGLIYSMATNSSFYGSWWHKNGQGGMKLCTYSGDKSWPKNSRNQELFSLFFTFSFFLFCRLGMLTETGLSTKLFNGSKASSVTIRQGRNTKEGKAKNCPE